MTMRLFVIRKKRTDKYVKPGNSFRLRLGALDEARTFTQVSHARSSLSRNYDADLAQFEIVELEAEVVDVHPAVRAESP